MPFTPDLDLEPGSNHCKLNWLEKLKHLDKDGLAHHKLPTSAFSSRASSCINAIPIH